MMVEPDRLEKKCVKEVCAELMRIQALPEGGNPRYRYYEQQAQYNVLMVLDQYDTSIAEIRANANGDSQNLQCVCDDCVAERVMEKLEGV